MMALKLLVEGRLLVKLCELPLAGKSTFNPQKFCIIGAAFGDGTEKFVFALATRFPRPKTASHRQISLFLHHRLSVHSQSPILLFRFDQTHKGEGSETIKM